MKGSNLLELFCYFQVKGFPRRGTKCCRKLSEKEQCCFANDLNTLQFFHFICKFQHSKMALELYGFPVSQPTRSVALLLGAADIEHVFKPINLGKGEHKSESYLAINPRGKVPAIRDGDFTLSEGAAILTYIAESRNLKGWLPEDVKQRARVNEWLHWTHTTVRRTSTINFIRPVFFKQPIANRDELVKEHAAVIGELETQLGKSKYLVGDVPTIADLFVVPEVDQLEIFGLFSYDSFPNVKRWLSDIATDVKSYNASVQTVKEIIAAFSAASSAQ